MKQHIWTIKLIITAAILLLVLVFVLIFSFNNSPSTTPQRSPIPGTASTSTVMATKVIHVADRSVTVSIADTPATQQKGLGGRSGLANDAGMLFVFSQDGRYAFWMKDMQFSIDIIWLSVDGTVITIAHSISPNTYPHSFVPSAPARYVLELPAGFSQTYNLKAGDKVQL